MVMIYDAIETILRSIVPEGCRIFQANIPLQLMDTLARETAKYCTYLVYKDKVRVTTSGISQVHDVVIEFSFYGSLPEVDKMSNDLTTLLVSDDVEAAGWQFTLMPSPNGRRDVWDPRIQSKREYLQFQGLAIEPDA